MTFPVLREIHWTGSRQLESQMPFTLEVFRSDWSDVSWPHLVGCPLLEHVEGPGMLPTPEDLGQWPRLRALKSKASCIQQVARLREVTEALPRLDVTLDIHSPSFPLPDKTPLMGLRVRHFETGWWSDGDLLPWNFVRAETMFISFLDVRVSFPFGLLQDSSLRAAGLQRLELFLHISSDRKVECPGSPFRVTINTTRRWFSVTVSWSAE